MARTAFLIGGFVSLLLAGLGAILPILPTAPFVILAAYCFGRSNKAFERRLLEHRLFGPHIILWRERRAISRRAKIAALVGFAASTMLGFVALDWPWELVPAAAAIAGSSWILSRPSA